MNDVLKKFLFAPVDPSRASLFRILLAAMIVIEFYPIGHGLAPEYHDVPYLWGLYDNVFLSMPYRLGVLLLVVPFGLGWHSRTWGFLLVFLLIPLAFLTSMNQSRQIFLFVLFSFSMLRSDVRGSAGPMWPVRLMQLQLSMIYGINALAKSTPEYLSGEVLMGLGQSLPNFLADFSDGFYHFGPLAIPVAMAATASMITEGCLAVGFWIPQLRLATAILGVSFHLVLKSIVSIGMLDWTSMFLYSTFLIPFAKKRPTH